jgi:hypothetical protein
MGPAPRARPCGGSARLKGRAPASVVRAAHLRFGQRAHDL